MSRNTLSTVKHKELRRTEHVSRTREKRNAYRICGVKHLDKMAAGKTKTGVGNKIRFDLTEIRRDDVC